MFKRLFAVCLKMFNAALRMIFFNLPWSGKGILMIKKPG